MNKVIFSPLYELINEGQNLCISLYDVFESNIFRDIDMTLIKGRIPLWIVDAGISPESGLGKVELERLISFNSNEITHKILYGYDRETLVATLQHRLSALKDLICHFFKYISPNSQYEDKDYERGVRHMGEQATVCFTFLNSIFITLGSMFDILTKIAIELENISKDKIDFSKYPKFKSSCKLYGQKYLVNPKIFGDTIFDEPSIIRQAITIRDEIIHNGSWDYKLAIYGGFKGDDYEEWIMMPDFENSGTFVSYKNRKRFYSKGDKMNVNLIPILIQIVEITNNTISKLNTFYKIEDTPKKYDINSFSKEIKNWIVSFSKFIETNEYKA